MYRFVSCTRVTARRHGFASVVLFWVLSFAAVPSAAQDAVSPTTAHGAPAPAAAQAPVSSASLAKVTLSAPQFLPAIVSDPGRRPKSLVPLYVSFASLQAMDIHSTTRALDRGAVEANPLMNGIAGNPLAMTAVKMAGSAGVIYAAEKMWKKNRKAAVIFMLATNVGMAWVVQHNYRAVQ